MSGDANLNEQILSSIEVDTIGEIMNISMGSAATAASTLLDHKVLITTPTVAVIPIADLDISSLEPVTAVEIKYVEGITGSNILMLRDADVRLILGKMMQMEMDEGYVIDELGQSAMCELMNQMMGSSATVLSCFLGRSINISTPTIIECDNIDEFKGAHFPGKDNIVTTKFIITIEGVMESEFMSVMTLELAKEIISVSLNFDDSPGDPEVSPLAPTPPPPLSATMAPPEMPATQLPPPTAAPMPPPTAPPPASAPDMYAAPQPYPPAQPYTPQQPYPSQQPYPPQPYPPQSYPPYPPQGYAPPPMQPPDPIMVQNYNYADFSSSGGGTQEMPANIDLVMDVPVSITVELGRTKRKIKEILEFGQGTIVELDKQAGSQVDVIVNGQLIARGDVVVVDDNFSIRITEILKNRDTLTML